MEVNIEDKYLQYVHALMRSKLGRGTTIGIQLQKAGEIFFGQKWAGVWASDRIPDLTNEHCYCIVNLDKHTQPGSHWVALAFRNRITYVYDSFGRETKNILPSLYKERVTVDAEHDTEQLVREDNCGQRCLAWLLIFDTEGPVKALTI